MLKQLTEVFKAYAVSAGLPDWIANDIAFILLSLGLLITVISNIYHWIGKLILFKNQMILKRDLAPYNYALSDVQRATKYYIPTRYQNVSPAEDEEPGGKYIASAKNKLIPLFLEEAFLLSKAENKYYLILADTGMGKTTFLINLYLAYKTRMNLPFSIRKFDIKLYPVWHPNTFADIEAIADKANTILLLDAFDEDIRAVENYKQRLLELLSVVNRFRVVVLTCRTQFFPSEEEEPHETGYFTGGEKGQLLFQKLYLSIFSIKDISRYLKKRYSLVFNFAKYCKAKKIISACPHLVVRPMLLYYIDDLLKIVKEVPYSYQIYEQLIAAWIGRESAKYSISKKYEKLQLFGLQLREFSQQLAIDLYEKRGERNGYFLPAHTDFAAGVLKMSDLEHEKLFDERDAKSKSLLNRNAAGDYKFSHKSILEYFLAREMFRQPAFFERFEFKGMDAAKRFLVEMIINKMCEGKGRYATLGKKRGDLGSLNLEMAGQLKMLACESISISPVFLSLFSGLTSVIYKDVDQLTRFLEFRYVVFQLSAAARRELASIGVFDHYCGIDSKKIFSTHWGRTAIDTLVSKLKNIKQAVQSFGLLFSIFGEHHLPYLRKVLGFNESADRVPDLIRLMTSSIGECVEILGMHYYESAKKRLTPIREAISQFNAWLAERPAGDRLDMIFTEGNFSNEKISISGHTDKWSFERQENSTKSIMTLEMQMQDFIEIDAFFLQAERLALKMPGCTIGFVSPLLLTETLDRKRSASISWDLPGNPADARGEEVYWPFSTTNAGKK
jgi:hypothetical protein